MVQEDEESGRTSLYTAVQQLLYRVHDLLPLPLMHFTPIPLVVKGHEPAEQL